MVTEKTMARKDRTNRATTGMSAGSLNQFVIAVKTAKVYNEHDVEKTREVAGNVPFPVIPVK